MSGGGGSAPAPAPSSTTQIQQLPAAARPFLYGGDGRAGLLPQAYELSQQPLQMPDYMVAGRTPTQVASEQMAREARGSYQPYLQTGEALTGQGVMATEEAGRLSQQELGEAQLERQAARAALTGALMGTTEAGMRGADLSEAERMSRQATGFGTTGLQQAYGQTQGIPAEARMAAERGMGGLGAAYGATSALMPESFSAAQRGISGFEGTGAEYDPSAVSDYMSPYQEGVIDTAMQDIARQGQLQLNEARAQAVRAGAFGGARTGVVESEIGRNILGEQARTAGRLRQEGFESAAGRSQAAFEAARQRQQAAASGVGQLGLQGVGQALTGAGQLANIGSATGQLGLQGVEQALTGAGQLANISSAGGQLGQAGAGQLADIRQAGAQTGLAAAGQAANIGGTLGQLGTSFGQLGQQAASQQAGFGQGLGALGAQMAGFGQQLQGQQLQDINTAATMGQQQQAQQQAYLDTARQNQYQNTMAPYQSLGFFSDIFQGAPTGTSAIVQQQQGAAPAASPASQLMGLGIGAYGLSQSGLFGGG